MRVLITGGAGFIGSHLAEALLAEGHEVVALDNLTTGNRRNVEHLQQNGRFHMVAGDILAQETLAPWVREADLVYHLAAAVGVKYVLENALKSLLVNVQGTENVLQLADRYGKKKVVLASSSEVYGKASKIPFREDDDSVLGPTTVPRWGYACSKALDEFLALAYWRTRRLPVVILRLFNTVGPRQTGHYGMVLPRFVAQALADDPITVYGDGKQLRSFTDVRDVVRAMVEIAKVEGAEGQVFNVGSDREVTINNLAALVTQTLGSSSPVVHVPYREVYGPDFEDLPRRLPDIAKLKRFIDYRPNTDLVSIIQRVAADMRAREGLTQEGEGEKRAAERALQEGAQ